MTGHEIAEMALLRLYEETGEREWLELANFFLDVRGTDPNTFALEENERRKSRGLSPLPVEGGRYTYYQAHMPVRRMKEAVGHAVRQMYLCSGMADAARINRDSEMEKACRRLWDSVVREKMYVTGGVGGTHVGEAFSRPFDLPSDTAYSETCAAVKALSIGCFSFPALRIPGRRVSLQADSPLYAPWQQEETRDTFFLLVPYFAWNNRGKGEMRVWLRAE